jgi:hypothetical protein
VIREPMRRANSCLEASRLEITRCLSMHGFRKGVKFPARIPKNKRRRTVATSRSNGSGRVRNSWKSSNSKACPSNWGGRMLKTSIWWADKTPPSGYVQRAISGKLVRYMYGLQNYPSLADRKCRWFSATSHSTVDRLRKSGRARRF